MLHSKLFFFFILMHNLVSRSKEEGRGQNDVFFFIKQYLATFHYCRNPKTAKYTKHFID